MRLTGERELVASVIFSLRPPFTAESVLASVLPKIRVSRATVYRTLAMLTDSGQVQIQSESKLIYTHEYGPPSLVDTPSQLCDSIHGSLIVGKCPWCGCNIIDGKPEDSQ